MKLNTADINVEDALFSDHFIFHWHLCTYTGRKSTEQHSKSYGNGSHTAPILQFSNCYQDLHFRTKKWSLKLATQDVYVSPKVHLLQTPNKEVWWTLVDRLKNYFLIASMKNRWCFFRQSVILGDISSLDLISMRDKSVMLQCVFLRRVTNCYFLKKIITYVLC